MAIRLKLAKPQDRAASSIQMPIRLGGVSPYPNVFGMAHSEIVAIRHPPNIFVGEGWCTSGLGLLAVSQELLAISVNPGLIPGSDPFST